MKETRSSLEVTVNGNIFRPYMLPTGTSDLQ